MGKFKFYLLLLSCFGVFVPSWASEIKIFSLIDEAGTSTQTLVVKESPNESNGQTPTACRFNYPNPASVSKDTIIWAFAASTTDASPVAFYPEWRKKVWRLAQWNSEFTFCDDNTTTERTATRFTLSNSGNEATPSMKLLLDKNFVIMSLRSISHWSHLFGNQLYYRKATEKHWPAMLLSKQYTKLNLTEYSKLKLTFKGELRLAQTVTNTLPSSPSMPSNAQTTYQSQLHGTQFRVFLPLEWNDYANRCTSASKPLYCKSRQGKAFHFGFQIYDDRFNYTQTSSMLDIGTNMMMYGKNLKDIINNNSISATAAPATNPYTVLNDNYTFVVDILPAMKEAILALEKKQLGLPPSGVITLALIDAYTTLPRAQQLFPVRLKKRNGSLETDDEYIKHFYNSTVNIGYEVPGLSHVQFKIDKFIMEGILEE